MSSFSFDTFGNVAAHLTSGAMSQATPEAFHRSAIGRNYYRAYHLARARVLAFRTLPDNADHGVVWDALRFHATNEDYKEAGRLGHLLRGARNHADYNASFRSPSWKYHCEESDRLAVRIENLLNPPQGTTGHAASGVAPPSA